ncbi:hypothetical protein GCM10027049_06230 [Mucilaginibacter puniceus]
MTPRSFWLIAIRLLAIFMLIQSINIAIQLLGLLTSYFNQTDGSYYPFSEYIIALIVFILYIIGIRYALFKTEIVIDKLRLDQRFKEDKFEFNISQNSILKIAVIIVGAFLFIEGFPAFCRSISIYFQNESIYNSIIKNPQTGFVIFYLFKALIGYFMVTDSKLIVSFIERKATV